METFDALLTRQSCRNFTNEPVSEQDLAKIIAAANNAPVGMAMFDCLRLTVIQDPNILLGLEETVLNINPNFTREHPLFNAPLAIVVSTKDVEGPYALMHKLSGACVMENMMVEAADLGLGSCYLMGAASVIAQSPEFMEQIGLPEGFTPMSIAIVGHSAQPLAKRQPVNDKIVCDFC
ncbi:nitroreductase family protein [Bifidobacterium magnum]|uniref:Nitroreductase n=1 Tax=Bifidobacterium magnum TaxID=1692 RepID=A0A087BEC0_9BIFI|nr:nitroreductase family protein [Bifidobacterium magnum]KFI69370.1 Nitroreductase [Bifidobacterium magnum]